MLLIDAVYINNSGGKILLDYLIETLERTNLAIFYLLDERIRHHHPSVKPANHCQYLVSSLLRRQMFYYRHKSDFDKIFCFGNLPPNIHLAQPVYTYFHQPLFIDHPASLPLVEQLIINLKKFVLSRFAGNTNYWIVQSGYIKEELMKKFNLSDEGQVIVIPFYPPLSSDCVHRRINNRFIYISGGASHKNQDRLIRAFQLFYDQYQTGDLHLSIGKEYQRLCFMINSLRLLGYPIVNHGSVGRDALKEIYLSSEYCIYPSLTESFGLGIIEALECGCQILGADRPYLYAVCEPSATFDPESISDIAGAMGKAFAGKLKPSTQKVFSDIDRLIDILAA
jgi:glycosyltransferase involved in cell wall biosynthesis